MKKRPYFLHCCNVYATVLQRGIEDIVKPAYCKCKWDCSQCVNICAYWIPDETVEKKILEDLK